MPTMIAYGDGTKAPASTYSALTRLAEGRWEVFDTKLPLVAPGGRVVFLDVNGDGLPDAVQSGSQDHALRTYFNTGPTFESVPVMSLGSIGLGYQDTYFRLAVPVDFNNDGKQDLLMPVPAGTLPEQSTTLPAWAVLQAKAGAQQEATFTLIDAGIPFEALLGDAITLADPHGPRIGDLDGDGAADVVLPLGSLFQVFRNRAADQDLLVAVSDGLNAHDPEDPGFVPNVEISYGHLSDAWITRGEKPGDSEREKDLYLSQDDAKNECGYPRRCVVGPHFELRYRDGRYHRLGRGFLGFGERIVRDLETGEITAEFFDNITYDDKLKAFPFAGQLARQERSLPGLHLERSFLDVTRTVVPTNDDATYFTLPTEQRVRHEQDGLVLRDITTRVTDFDEFGHVLAEEMSAAGVDLTFQIERTFKNDTTRWILGQLESQKVCSTAAGLSQCRLLSQTNTIYGEPESETLSSDDKSPDTQLTITYQRDGFGNIIGVTASDAYGHKRSSRMTYDTEGVFPETYVNAAGHTTLLEFDAGLGVLTRWTDPNQLVTERRYDSFGRLGLETRPDGSQTTITLSRSKEDRWHVRARSVTTGGADDTVEYDSRGRPIRLELAIEGEALQATLGYDELGRVSTITYPTPAGAQPFVVAQDFDAYGHMLAVRDAASDLVYWRLSEVDGAGRFQKEIFGNDVVTERSYFTDKQLLKSIFTQHGATQVQNLSYEYDERLSLESRTDALQAQNPTERFRYDPLDRLTCAYFSPTKNVSAPCALSYGYAPNGNLTSKSDVGTLTYGDPTHPHAVTNAGSDSFFYDAVGNQVTRPGATLSYTPFDLPRTIAQAMGTISFGYDGDEQRIRKSTPTQETLYFGDLYERMSEKASGTTAHRYYVHSPERPVAIVTRGGAKPGTLYLHVEHLGSIDAISNEAGTVVERRSYDPFGQRRNPTWGAPTPMSFSNATTLGFTGHESDDELGLINAKGRIYDPKVGRFLSVDPIVSAPLFGQSWNAYSYVWGNPLAYTDPSGFDPAYQEPPVDPGYTNDPDVQIEGGFLAGLGLGFVPCAGVEQNS